MIPIVDLTAATSYAKQNPAVTIATVLVLLLGVYGFYWVTKKYPKAKGKLLLAIFCTYVGFGVWLNWQMFEPQPSILEKAQAAAQKYRENIQDFDVVLLNKNDDPQPGARVSFQETQGDQCIYHGKVIEPGTATLNRKRCPDGIMVMQDGIVPLNTRGTGDQINHFKAFIKVKEG